VIGSVAGDRGRQSNYPYGAAKAGLERYVEGLQHRFALGSGSISAHLVKPGFVDSPMTEGMEKGGPLWATPDQVAQAIWRGVSRGRTVLYVPSYWLSIMAIIRAVPGFVLHKTRL
jgi:NAD(P)-dependent dehydrogenase (short-subunit alcohol dehydrogenase family)